MSKVEGNRGARSAIRHSSFVIPWSFSPTPDMSSAITSVTSTSAAATGAETGTALPPQTLSQDDFLKLLVAQLTSQDPMNPQTDTQFAAQMAQFTALQQTSTISDNIATMLAQQQVLQANSMLGGTVSLLADGKAISGVVEAVQFDSGVPKVVVNGAAYDLSQVLTLEPTPIPPPVAAN